MARQKDTNFDIMISKMKNNENHNKAEIRKLSKELECERKKSEAYHKWADEAFSKIKLVVILFLEITPCFDFLVLAKD